MKRIACILFAALLLLTGCTSEPKDTAQPTEPPVPTEPASPTEPVSPTEPPAPTEPASPTGPVSGKYCVLGVDGKTTYPEWTALKFDFENNRFDFGRPHLDSSWTRKGEFTVEGSRITAVNDAGITYTEGDQMKTRECIWLFELAPDGSLRFITEGSEVFEVYGTQLNEESVIVRTGDLDKSLE